MSFTLDLPPNLNTKTLKTYNLDYNSIVGSGNQLDSLIQSAEKYSAPSNILDPTFVSSAPTSVKNGLVIETNPPKVPADISKTLPEKDQPSTTKYQIGQVGANTGIGKSNEELTYVCDFTIDLKMKVCNKTFDVLTENFTKTLKMKELSLELSQIPFLQYIKTVYATLKGWYDYVMKYVNMISAFIKCIADILAGITAFIAQLATLPISLLSQAMGCLTGTLGLLKNAAMSGVYGIQKDISEQTNVSTAKSNADTAQKSSDDYYQQFSTAINSYF